jgi:hypothetical protein
VHFGIGEGLRRRLRGAHRGLGERRKAQLVPDVRLTDGPIKRLPERSHRCPSTAGKVMAMRTAGSVAA